MESFPKLKAHFPLIYRASHLIVRGSQAGEALFALSQSTLAVSNHLDYCEAACGIQADLHRGLPGDWGYTDQSVVQILLLACPEYGYDNCLFPGIGKLNWLPQTSGDVITRPTPSVDQLPLMPVTWFHRLGCVCWICWSGPIIQSPFIPGNASINNQAHGPWGPEDRPHQWKRR